MSKYDKLLKKLLQSNTITTFLKLEYNLGKLGYNEKKTGKTSRSRIAYINLKPSI